VGHSKTGHFVPFLNGVCYYDGLVFEWLFSGTAYFLGIYLGLDYFLK
jgi:hypothetical protein